jgi:Kef-type K+ transport system membrane component KefB
VTAFPVLARILTDRGLSRSRLGVLVLACASIDDVTAWCLLAVVVGVAQAQVNNAIITIGLTIAYIVLMLWIARPIFGRYINQAETGGRISRGMLAFIFLLVLASSLMTEFIGIHALFGAFLIGAIIPHSSRVAREMTHSLENVVGILLLPIFFAFTGLRTQIGLLQSWNDIFICLAIIAIATLGKFVGGMLTSRLFSISWGDSAAVGILMNTRGLIELIVLNIGLEMHVISPTLFTMLVIMSLVTTVGTTPILDSLLRRGKVSLVSPENVEVVSPQFNNTTQIAESHGLYPAETEFETR